MDIEIKEHQKALTKKILLYATITTFLLAVISKWGLDISGKIPIVFGVFSITMFAVYALFVKNKNLIQVYFIGSGAVFFTMLAINLYSGGINGVLNYFYPIIVIAGYAMSKNYGRFWLIASILTMISFYSIDPVFIQKINEVPDSIRPILMLLSVVIGTITLGAIYGEYLISLILQSKIRTKEIAEKNTENEILLKEVHHRVKNNMQVVSGLLSLQSSLIPDPKIKEHFKVSQNRIKTMAIVHEMLYAERDFAAINFEKYLNRLVDQLIKSIKGTSDNISVKIQVGEVDLNLDTAVPLGLMVNEIVTNSLKYGFLYDSKGEINISLEVLQYPNYILHIGDNGVGCLPEDSEKSSQSFGLNLVENLAKQLKGEVVLEKQKSGTNYVIHFQEINKNSEKSTRIF